MHDRVEGWRRPTSEMFCTSPTKVGRGKEMEAASSRMASKDVSSCRMHG